MQEEMCMEKKQQICLNDAQLSTDDYLRQKAATEKLDNISLKNNYAFKKTFKNKTVLKGFLMALLELTEDEIVELEITDPFEDGENDREKEGILDIKIHMNKGIKLNLEMQNRSQYDWSERSIFYNCRMFTDGFLHGMDYGQLEPCIHVGILDFKQLESRGFHHNILLMDKASHEIYSSKFLFHVIELSKLQDATEEEKSRELYQWAVMLAAERVVSSNL
jgi:predicted transposase/invertase (TIGR01784 family)